MKKAKRVVFVMLCVLLCLAMLAGCGGGGTGGTGGTGGPSPIQTAKPSGGTPDSSKMLATPPAGAKLAKELTVGAMQVSVIDPGNRAFYTPQVAWICSNIYDTLVKLTPDGKYIPMLATEWKTTDYKTINFKLRNDVTFHNGEKLKADDVVFTWERGKASKGTTAGDNWGKIDSIKVVNDYEIAVTYKVMNIDYLYDLSTPSTSILNRKAVGADKDKGTWIGTGPYKVDSLVVNQNLDFVRNDNYWGTKAYTEKLHFKYIAEASATLIALDNGEVDVAMGLDATYLPTLEKNPKYLSIPFVVNNVAYVGFNLKDPLMADINFRTAVAYGMNRADCVSGTRNGYAVTPKSGTFWGYDSEFKNNDVPLIPYDVAKAKEYLAKTKYKGEEIEIVTAIPDHISNSQILQENLKAVGINIKIYQSDPAGINAYTAQGKHKMIVYSGSWASTASSIKSFVYPGNAGNKAFYENANVKTLIDKADVTANPAEREKIYKDIQVQVAKDLPYIPIFNMIYEFTLQKGVGGIGVYSSLNHDLSHVFKVVQ